MKDCRTSQWCSQGKNVLHAMKANGAVELQHHSFLITALDSSQWSVTPWSFYTWETSPRYPLNSRLCGAQIRFVRFSKKEANFYFCQESKQHSSNVQPVWFSNLIPWLIKQQCGIRQALPHLCPLYSTIQYTVYKCKSTGTIITNLVLVITGWMAAVAWQ